MGLSSSKRATHVITGPPSEVDKALGTTGKAAVYGRKDLKRRLKAASELGVPVQVRKLKRDER
ncbi:hypothetical protein [Streptosporangium jomthongense]|uniref:Uncharacterized protein n=1 Tax=Streptosporangium jomthongense TaxID=1193683 RepID=A0ABV8ETH8_9ACTN